MTTPTTLPASSAAVARPVARNVPPTDGAAGTSGNFDGVDALLADARSRLHRLPPRAAYAAVRTGALLVDIRPAAQRAAEGELGASVRPLVIERNVLEWRLDPNGDARLPQASADRPVVVICQEGYASSLAADSLRSLGLAATDVEGGYAAWRALGLPVTPEPAPVDPS